MTFPNIIKAIKNSHTKSVPKGDGTNYNFQVMPFGELGSLVSSELIKEITDGLTNGISKFEDYDYIVTTEPGGHTWALLVGHSVSKSVNIIRENSTGSKDEFSIFKTRGYDPKPIFLNNFKSGDKIIIIEDVISSGGTLASIIEELVKRGVNVKSVICIYAKSDSYLELQKRYSVPIIPLVTFRDL